MNTIDKFGNQFNAKKGGMFLNSQAVRETFPLDKDGNYNSQNKRIKLVHDPVEKQDVVNKRWLETNFLRTEKDYITIGHKRLTNLSTPKEMSDAVTKGFVEGRLLYPSENSTAFDFLGKTLKNVGESQDRRDVATVSFVEKRCAKLHDDLTYEIKTRTDSAYSSFNDTLEKIKTEISGIKALVTRNATVHTKLVENDKRGFSRGNT